MLSLWSCIAHRSDHPSLQVAFYERPAFPLRMKTYEPDHYNTPLKRGGPGRKFKSEDELMDLNREDLQYYYRLLHLQALPIWILNPQKKGP